MNESAFVQKREADWRRLTQLTDLASSPHKLSDDQLDEFVRLYRRASADLALARTQSTNEVLTSYLNDLVARAYGFLYVSRRRPFWPTCLESIAVAARTVRKRRFFVLLSALIFFGSWFGFYGLLTVRPDLQVTLATPQSNALAEMWRHHDSTPRTSSTDIAMWGFYSANNPYVDLLAMASSVVSFGVGTVFNLCLNGKMTGQLLRSEVNIHQGSFMLGTIFPHGVPEISGAILSGAAGFILGWALIYPGRKTRGNALREAARDAGVIILAAIVLTYMAAPIEAFFSYNEQIPLYLKYGVGFIEVIGWGLFRLPDGTDPPDPSVVARV
jgi:uncharacterized membrane protein SpoIIM required for sporulation